MNAFLVDIGGTWTRFRTGDVVEQVPTPSRLRHREKSSDTLVRELVSLIAERAPANTRAYVSLGAAYDASTDIASGSGPLWGPDRLDVPFRRLLEWQRPDVLWSVTNDVTAALAHFTELRANAEDRGVMYITISSGIALRTAHLPTRSIDVNAEGLQGEVGHLLATSTASEEIRTLRCQCGGFGHVAAISAGPAIPLVSRRLGLSMRQSSNQEGAVPVRPDDRLLRVIVEPIANLIRTAVVLQPHIDLVGIGGGVPSGMGEPYRRELCRQLSTAQSYADGGTAATPRLILAPSDEVRPEIGAELVAQGYLLPTK